MRRLLRIMHAHASSENIPGDAAGANVLLVEPDRTIRESIAGLLEQAGYHITTADSVPAALKVMSVSVPNLVIAAVRIHGDNGLQIVAMSPRPSPAIILSGSDDSALEVEARRMGAEFLATPVPDSALLALVERMLRHRPMGLHSSKERRWARRPAPAGLEVFVDDVAARVVDVSYGGLRIEVASSRPLPLSEPLSLTSRASRLDVNVQVVWASTDTFPRVYGACVPETTVPAWSAFVDALG